ncbi:MAG: bifunctional demethylmenaquinone methyltransferase/2-methoxy-6-polyprenyl-1,4-benzoquinol methylase UbiE [Candidatus Acidiferrales bacterium]
MSASPGEAPLPGTRPEGTSDEAAASARVQEMFSRIAPCYDFLNHLLSFSLDRMWRRAAAERFLHILRRTDARVLDVCCGTGDLAFALERTGARTREKHRCDAAIMASDFAAPMLRLAATKAQARTSRVRFLGADALALPFRDESFDLVVCAFGFRNLSNYERGLRELARVLKRGGELGILEFNEPQKGTLARMYRFYFTRILPRIGGAISRNAAAYSYLPASVGKFPQAEEFRAWMERAGFRETHSSLRSFGAVALHTAKKI